MASHGRRGSVRKRQGACVLAFIALVWTNAVALAQEDIAPPVKDRHQAALQAFLARHPHLAVAPQALCRCDDTLERLRKDNPQFHPYYAVGDINDDGIEDFAVGLIDTRQPANATPLLTVVVFHGPFSAKRRPKGVTVLADYRVQRPSETLGVLEPKVERGHRYPARLALGDPQGTDDFVQAFFDWKRRRYHVGPG